MNNKETLKTKDIYELRLEEATTNYKLTICDRNKYASKLWLKIIKDYDKILANLGEW